MVYMIRKIYTDDLASRFSDRGGGDFINKILVMLNWNNAVRLVKTNHVTFNSFAST